MKYVGLALALVSLAPTALAHTHLSCVQYADGGACSIDSRKTSWGGYNVAPRWNGVGTPVCEPTTNQAAGTIAPGGVLKLMWPARNHAVNNQSPNTVKAFLAPGFGTPDISAFTEICTGPYINCGNGPNVDTGGDGTPCTLDCTIPATQAAGDYTLLWDWDWTQNDGNHYTSCADISVGGSPANPGPPPVDTPTTSGDTTTTAPTAPTATGTITPAVTSPPTTGGTGTKCTTGVDICKSVENTLTGNKLTVVNKPTEVPMSGTFPLEATYSAETESVIILDILDASVDPWNFHGQAWELVTPGKGHATLPVVLNPPLTAGKSYTIKAFIVEKSKWLAPGGGFATGFADAWKDALYDNDPEKGGLGFDTVVAGTCLKVQCANGVTSVAGGGGGSTGNSMTSAAGRLSMSASWLYVALTILFALAVY
jgi:hypothetical protein